MSYYHTQTISFAGATTAATPLSAAAVPPLPPITYVIAVDVSGSTGGSAVYYGAVRSAYERLCEEARTADPLNEVVVLHWDSECKRVTPNTLRTQCNVMRSGGGTVISRLASMFDTDFKNTVVRKLVLFTDGEVHDSEVKAADTILNRIRGTEERILFEEVEVSIVALSPSTTADTSLSVSCPFTRGVAHRVNLITPQQTTLQVEYTRESVQAAELALSGGVDSPKTFEAFEQESDSIEKYLLSQCVGQNSDVRKLKVLRGALLEMQRRIVVNEAKMLSSGDSSSSLVYAEMTTAIEARNFEEARRSIVKCVESVCTAGTREDAMNFASKMSKFLKWTEGSLAKTYKIGEIRAASAQTALPVDATTALGAAIADADDAGAVVEDTPPRSTPPWECPILMDAATKTILIRAVAGTPPALADEDASLAKQILDAPLNGLTGRGGILVLNKMLARCASVVGLASICAGAAAVDAAVADGDYVAEPTLDPLTREPILDVALVLGESQEAVAATDSALRTLLTGGKRISSPDLVYTAFVWGVVCGGAVVPYESFRDHVPELVAHLKYRLLHHTAPLGLSGLATSLFRSKVPLHVALWFVHESTAVVSTFKAEPPIVLHMPAVPTIRWLVEDVLEYEVAPDDSDNATQLKFLRYVQFLSSAVKGGVKRPLHPSDHVDLADVEGGWKAGLSDQHRIRRIAAAVRALRGAHAVYIPEFAAQVRKVSFLESDATSVDFVALSDPRDFSDFDKSVIASEAVRTCSSDPLFTAVKEAETWLLDVMRIPLDKRFRIRYDLIETAASILKPGASFLDYIKCGFWKPLYDAFEVDYAAKRAVENNTWHCLKTWVGGVLINVKTCRPFYTFGSGTWVDEAKRMSSTVHTPHPAPGGATPEASPHTTPCKIPKSYVLLPEVLSLTRYFMDYTNRAGRWPTHTEMLLYVLARVGVSVLPFCIVTMITEQFEIHSEIMFTLSVEEAIKRYTASQNISQRVKIEKSD